MKIGKFFIVTVAFAGITLVGSSVFAGEKPTPSHDSAHPEHHQHMPYREDKAQGRFGGKFWRGKMAEELNLTEDQKSAMQKIHQQAREASMPARKEMKASRSSEKEALISGADEQALKAIAVKTSEHRVDLMLIRHKAHEEMMAVLTPEQKSRMEELHAERRALHEERMKKWKEQREAGGKTSE